METLTIAVQKKGRMSDRSLALFREAGIRFTNGQRKLIALSKDFPVRLLYLRDDDIPQYVADGVADAGIVGENEVLEKNRSVDVAKKLGFASCRLSLAIPKEVSYAGVQWFDGKRIATSYPQILTKYLLEKGIRAEVHQISGSVEIAPGIGLADAIFDIVSSGSTLISNGLQEVEVVLQSEAVLIRNMALSDEKQALLNQLLFRINAARAAEDNKYILLNAPNNRLEEIVALIPGMKSPTIVPLADKKWSSVHSVVKESEFWQVIDKLQDAGAEGILVVSLEKMIV
ncbi:MAG: ATP phosphoribosyltransferase [Salinivirgaceae bacterium]